MASGGDVQPVAYPEIHRHRPASMAHYRDRVRFSPGKFADLLGGEQLINFTLGLVFLGLGWSFVYIGATTLLVTTLPQADQPKAQMINELFIWAASAAAAGASG